VKYKSKIQLLHTDGETITIDISGPSPEKVAHIANQIKDRNAQNMDKTVIERERMWYDFCRDFFGLRKGASP
jgi:capsular polysaccharide biosynthesis protein